MRLSSFWPGRTSAGLLPFTPKAGKTLNAPADGLDSEANPMGAMNPVAPIWQVSATSR